MERKTFEYETSDGVILKIHAVPSRTIEAVRIRVRRELEAEGKILPQPTRRSAKAAGGETYEMVLTELSLEGPTPEVTLENKAKWAAYQESLDKAEQEENAAAMNALLALGVQCEVPDPEEWFDDLKWAGVLDELPEDARDQKVAWLLYVALSDLDRDTVLGMISAMQVGRAVTDEQLDIFRRDIEGAASREIERAFAAATNFAVESSVDGDGPLLGDEDGEGVGDTA